MLETVELLEIETLSPPDDEPEPEPEIESIGPEEEPFEAAERYRKEFRSLNGAVVPAFLIALLSVVPMAVEQFGIEIPYWTGDLMIQSVVELACLAITAVLCRGVPLPAPAVHGSVRLLRLASGLGHRPCAQQDPCLHPHVAGLSGGVLLCLQQYQHPADRSAE